MPATARVTGRREAAVVPPLYGRDAAEIEVLTAPADELVAEALEAIELGRVAASLAVDMPVEEAIAAPRVQNLA